MTRERKIRYGEPGVLSDEVFVVAAKTMDDEGVPWDGNSHVRLEDRESGERWTLTAKQAHELALALMAAARDVNRAGGR